MPPELREKLKDVLPPPPPKKQTPAIVVPDECPQCGSPMTVRQARGRHFLGCTKYPKCKGTKEPSPEVLEQLANGQG